MLRRIGPGFASSVFALACLLPPALPAAEEADREALLLFNTASHFYRQKNWKEASEAFGAFLKRHPASKDAPEARFAAGYCLNRLGDHAAAVELLQLATKDAEGPWTADAWFYLGRSLDAIGLDPTTSADDRTRRLEAAAAAYGRSAEVHAKRRAAGEGDEHRDLMVLARGAQGESLYQARKHRESAEALETVFADGGDLSASPHYHRAIYVLALARHALAGSGTTAGGAATPDGGKRTAGGARYAGAREVLRAAADPRFEKEALWEEAAYLLARLSHEDRDLDEAVREYGRVKEKRLGRAAEAAFHRGVALQEMGKPEPLRQAREELSRFSRDYPSHPLVPRARFQEGLCAFDAKDWGAAEALFAKVAQESRELAGRAFLRRGQALLLATPPDPGRAAESLRKAVDGLEQDLAANASDASRASLVADALYWLGEAELARGGEGLEDAARSFGQVRTRFATGSPEVAEKAVYQEARALHLAGRLRESHEAAELYRRLYTSGKGAWHAETLLISAECAFHGKAGEVPDGLRAEAPRLYREARAGLKDPAEARRAWYMEGLSRYFLGEYREAAAVLDELSAKLADDPAAAAALPDLPYYLADSLAQQPRPKSPSAEDRERWKRAVELYRAYVERSGGGKNVPGALVNLGLCQEWLDDHAGARDTFRRFLGSYPAHELAAQVQFELANALVRLGDRQGARSAYAAASDRLGAASTDEARALLAARALYQKGLLEREAGDPGAAATTLQALLDRHGAALGSSADGKALASDAAYQRALALLEGGRRDEAGAAMEKLLASEPNGPHEAEARTQLARSLLDGGEAARALEALGPLLEAGPTRKGRDQALYLAAWCHAALASAEKEKAPAGSEAAAEAPSARAAEVEAAYRKLLAEHPASPLIVDAALELGQQLFNRKAYPEAKRWLEQVRESLEAEVGPVSPETAKRTRAMLSRALTGLGFIAFEAKEYETAAALLDKVEADGTGELGPRAAFQSGKAFLRLGNVAEASRRFQTVADRHDGDPGTLHEESLLRLAECQHQLQQYREAARTADRLLAEYPQGSFRHEARFVRGFAELFLKELDKAAATFREVVAGTGAPVAARAQYHLGESLVEQAKFRDAAREFSVVVANFDLGGEYEAWVRRALLAAGMAYQSAGDLEAAATQYRELAAKHPASDEGKAAAERLEAIAPGGKP